jgi:hypothetical protein
MIIHYKIPSNPSSMLLEAEPEEGLVAEEEEADFLVNETTKMIQNLRTKLSIILIV